MKMIWSHQATTIAGRQEATKRQLSPPDQVVVNVSDSPYQPKIVFSFKAGEDVLALNNGRL